MIACSPTNFGEDSNIILEIAVDSNTSLKKHLIKEGLCSHLWTHYETISYPMWDSLLITFVAMPIIEWDVLFFLWDTSDTYTRYLFKFSN